MQGLGLGGRALGFTVLGLRVPGLGWILKSLHDPKHLTQRDLWYCSELRFPASTACSMGVSKTEDSRLSILKAIIPFVRKL